MTLHAPVLLDGTHDLMSFNCGVPSLDDWLKRRALANQASGASRTFVLREDDRIVGYYALASGAVRAEQALSRFRRNMPDPIPVVILARLAIDRSVHKRGLGRALVQDAARRVLTAAGTIGIRGIRGILVHAISPAAEDFYRAIGFSPSPLDSKTFVITLADLRKVIAPDSMS